jgi:hypothetical protein
MHISVNYYSASVFTRKHVWQMFRHCCVFIPDAGIHFFFRRSITGAVMSPCSHEEAFRVGQC